MQFVKKWISSKNFKKNMIIGFLFASALFWLGTWWYSLYYVSTDDAYVNANVVQIAPRVTGQITNVYVVNNQHVHQYQPLFDLDSEPFRVAVEKAQAEVAVNQAALTNAQSKANRTLVLVTKQYVSPQEGDNVNAALQTAQASLQLAKSTLDQINLDLTWTKVTASTSGWVTNMSLRVGDNVIANQPLFVLISDREFWIDANFKETELEHIKPGQLASIKVDMYPHHSFKGVVESISGGAGAAFSLLPPQNATGNWVKVTQRIPVRIRVIDPDPDYPLRIGASADVTIDLQKMVR